MIKLTPKREKFAKKFVELGSGSAAYRAAFDAKNMKPNSIHVNASKLLADANVKLRVAELQAQAQKRHEVTVDSLTAELEQSRNLALAIEQPASAVSATMGKARIHGLLIDKSEFTGKDGGPIEITDPKAILLRGIVRNTARKGADKAD